MVLDVSILKQPFCFVTVAFGPRYVEQYNRLLESIEAIYPDPDVFSWIDRMPPGAKTHEESLYGFKVHAIAHARARGFNRIIWVDPACILMKPVEYYWEEPGMPAVTVVMDDNSLDRFISDKAISYFEHPDIIGLHLVGGSLYVFDFNRPEADVVFSIWAKAEVDGIFGTAQQAASEQINKHRYDESCMAVSLMMAGQMPVGHDVAKYCNGPDSIWDKKHFKL